VVAVEVVDSGVDSENMVKIEGTRVKLAVVVEATDKAARTISLEEARGCMRGYASVGG
jgi:hypothetical protein